jgi:hypothetical protein
VPSYCTQLHRQLHYQFGIAISVTLVTRLSKLTSVIPMCNEDASSRLCHTHTCQLSRHVHLPLRTTTSRAINIFDLIHYDLRTSLVLSVSGYKYYLVVLDDCSHYLWTFPLRLKFDAFPTLTQFFAYVKTKFGVIIKAVKCDNGREFDNSSSRTFFLTHVSSVCPAPTPHLKTVKLSASSVLPTTPFAHFYFMPASHQPFGLKLSTRQRFFSTYYPPRPFIFPLHTSPSSTQYPPTNTFACSVAPAIPTSLPPLATNLIPAPLSVLFLATSRITKGTGVLTSYQTVSFFSATLFSMSPPFPLLNSNPPPPPKNLTSWTTLALTRCHHL